MMDFKGVRKIREKNISDLAIRQNKYLDSKYDDLRQLETAIREAYVAKELRAQIIEAEAARVGAEARDRLKNEMLKREIKEAEKLAEEKNREKKSEKINYGLELKEAVKIKQEERNLAREIERRERKIIEQVSKVIEENDEARKISEKIELAERMSRELLIFREIKEIRLQEEAEVSEAARQRDFDYMRETDRRIVELKKRRKEQELARESVIEMVSKNLLESREKMLELEAIIADLVTEEKLFEEEMSLRKEEERRKIAAEEATTEMERHRIIIEERKLRHAIEEEEFAAAVMRKVLEDRRIERLTIEARKRKQIEYRKSLEYIIEERRTRRTMEIQKLKESLRLERERADAARKLVKDMRKRLLIRHAENVAEFIASRALSKEEKFVLQELIDPPTSTRV